ncbi:MAG: hypothetical protein V2A61_00960 [Calditrichota bacterium]
MRNLVGALAAALALFILLPGPATAGDEYLAKRYGIDIQVGGGYYGMQDINNFIPDVAFIDSRYKGKDSDDINFGLQFGLGFNYRHMENFGWNFGLNYLSAGIPGIMEQKFRRNAFLTGVDESWTEQTISGREVYILPTWYWPWRKNEVILGIGPAFYTASMDRAISIVRSSGSGANPAGSFDDASGTSLGLLINGGVEIPIENNLYLMVLGGVRLAKVGTLTYTDNSDVEQKVLKNTASNATLAADFSGFFVKVALRTYFQPQTEWRSPGK